ncbi:MAG: Ig-like domain-containing protein [Planctomycetota bacterium]|nr:Ig-like domain-containing protein [Planctomycetota bacterium]
MLRTLFSRTSSVVALVTVLALSCFATSCGGGGYAAKDMILVELQFLDRGLSATAPTGTTSLPRNAIIGLVFSELVNPFSVNNQTIQIRFGPAFQSVPDGSFQVNGNQVLFDPTVTAQGQPNPPGFQAITQYIIDVPGVGEQASVLENLDEDPNLTTFFTQFTTSDGWLRELSPPEVEGIVFAPEPDALTGNIPGNGLMGIMFTEAMDPSSFIQGTTVAGGTIDIRYEDDSGVGGINSTNGVAGSEIDGSFTPSPDWKTFWFKPLFSFGAQKLTFTVQCFQGLTDLSGNLLVNPGSFGPYTCDGNGIATGKTIKEDFLTTTFQDSANSDADWGTTEEGFLLGLPVTSRQVYIYSYVETDNGSNSGRGQYAPLAAPLIGADINNFVANVTPPSADGRRVMWSFSAQTIGQKGSVTSIGWGPDSNATFAAFHSNIKLRLGYQKDDSLSLSPSFSGNYDGQPALVYDGDYSISQAANVGDTPGHPAFAHVTGYGTNPGCNPTNGVGVIFDWNLPLFQATGWVDWPELSTFFEWDPEGAPDSSKKVMLFDASCVEGDSFQQVRGWFGVTFPCSGVLIGGLPLTRMYATYEEDIPNPASNFVGGVQNPEQSISDTCFTLTRRVSQGQSLFYEEGLGANTTFGDLTDYLPAVITPSVQSGGASVEIEYQGADAYDIDPQGNQIVNQAGEFTADDVTGEPTWVKDINKADGMKNLRYRIRLISNLISLATARVSTVVIPMTQN